MMTVRVYLDHNATSPLRPPARAAMTAALNSFGNPSSVHAEGRAAHAEVVAARTKVASLVGADPKAVTFTSGATESVAFALSPLFEIEGRPVRCDVLMISAVEHPAVRAGGRFAAEAIETIPVNRDGVIDLAALEAALVRHQAAGHRALVSVMAANNETGVIEPVAKIAERVHAVGGLFHSDAVQIAGRVPFDLAASGADLISLSSHKLGGPQGAGALIVRDEAIRVPPMLRGGGQERGRRAGTENVPAIAGFGAAAEYAALAAAEETGRLAGMRDRLEEGIRAIAPDAVMLCAGTPRLPNTTCFAVPGIAAETAVIAFDLEGVAVSAGAACSSGKVGPSEALAAMQVPAAIAKGAVRVSLGWNTVEEDIAGFLLVWKRLHSTLGQRRRERAA